ncbi:MAG: RNB domain-containing ribonuclease [Deltaproteobacteria bacterium]|nr:RNB domain-containing ribonuclease [Deltaproteobacteria bacterium]
MNEGKIIEFIDQGHFVCTVCLQDKGNRLHLLTPLNREINLSPKRAILISKASLNVTGSREDVLNRLRKTDALRSQLKERVEVKEIWELIKDEEESFGYKYLTELCFGEAVTDDHISAIVRALFEDKLYFKMKDGCFLPNPEDRVDRIIMQREEEIIREEKLSRGSAWIRDVLQGLHPAAPTCKNEIVDSLIDLALYGNEARNYKYGKELLTRSGFSNIEDARKILIRLGIWEEDENLDLHRMGIKASFSDDITIESEGIACRPLSEEGRVDLRDLHVITIDGPLTKDFDDALSLEIDNDVIQLGIHIADVAEGIPPESSIDKNAFHRASSLYLPRRQIPMIPPNLSQDCFSLLEGQDRIAITLLARFDRECNLLDSQFMPSVIRVRRRLTYDQVNDCFHDDIILKTMIEMSQTLRKQRIERGAMVLTVPEVIVEIDPDASLSISLMGQDTPSRLMVAEFMILYNWMAARFCRDNRVPVLYRGQDKPDERLFFDGSDYIAFVFKQRRKLKPMMVGTEPKPHVGLGVDVYTNATSPIRRYLDLIAQRQMRQFLFRGEPVYDADDLEQIRMAVEPTIRALQRVKRNRVRYWVQKYLMQHMDGIFEALVLYSMKRNHRILLTDFILLTDLKREARNELSEGQRIWVRIKKADPWLDELKVVYEGKVDRPS